MTLCIHASCYVYLLIIFFFFLVCRLFIFSHLSLVRICWYPILFKFRILRLVTFWRLFRWTMFSFFICILLICSIFFPSFFCSLLFRFSLLRLTFKTSIFFFLFYLFPILFNLISCSSLLSRFLWTSLILCISLLLFTGTPHFPLPLYFPSLYFSLPLCFPISLYFPLLYFLLPLYFCFWVFFATLMCTATVCLIGSLDPL